MVISNEVFKAVLDEDLILIWVCWIVICQFEEAGGAPEINFKNDGNFARLQVSYGETFRHGITHTCANVAHQIDALSGDIGVCLLFAKLETPIELGVPL